MDFLELCKSRRSVRRYEEKEVPEDAILKILEAGRWAPSGLNNQPWKFMVVRKREKINELAEFTKYKHIVERAKALIVVFLDLDEMYDRIKDVQAIGASIQNMLLEAHNLGLGSCWIGEVLNRKEKVEEFLGVPENLELMAFITLGYPSEAPKSSRKNLEEILIKFT
jgi:nitroreductase